MFQRFLPFAILTIFLAACSSSDVNTAHSNLKLYDAGEYTFRYPSNVHIITDAQTDIDLNGSNVTNVLVKSLPISSLNAGIKSGDKEAIEHGQILPAFKDDKESVFLALGPTKGYRGTALNYSSVPAGYHCPNNSFLVSHLVFFTNDSFVNLSIHGPIQEVLASSPQYATELTDHDKKTCDLSTDKKYYSWKDQASIDAFFQAVKAGTAPKEAMNWYNAANQIIQSVRLK